jgi:predicted permease
MHSFASDFRHAFRSLAKTPGFSIVALLTLAVGIGGATAMFSALRALVIEPFSYPEGDALVMVWSQQGQPFSTPDYFDHKEQNVSFSEFGVYTSMSANLGGERPQSVTAVSCTAGVLRAFGVSPSLGRLLNEDDVKKGAPNAVVISNRLWRQNFAADTTVIGRHIRLNGGDAVVVGVMPPTFEFSSPWLRTESCELWQPLQIARGDGDRGSHWLCAIGRLKKGVTLQGADADIKSIGAKLRAAYPNTNSQKPFLVRSLKEEMTRNMGSTVWMLFSAVVLVLLVACANVASMLLARNARRQGEIGVRIALGASRWQILRLALCESLLLSFAGVLAGSLVAYAGLHALQLIAPASEARRAAMTLDTPVLAFGAALSFLTALLSGLPPALASLRVSVSEQLRVDSRSSTSSLSRHRMLRALIVSQVAVAFVLANGAALFSASYAKLLSANSNLATDRVLACELSIRGERYKDKEARSRFFDLLATRAEALPGVAHAGITTKLPLEGGSNMDILVNDEVFDPKADRTLAEVSSTTPGYFAAAGIPLLRGRILEPRDAGEKERGVVVNRALADKCWPGQDPLGKIIRPDEPKASFQARVVGVVENVRQWGPTQDPRPEIYWTPEHAWSRTLNLVLRSPQNANFLTSELRRLLAELDPDLPLGRVRTFQTVVDGATKGSRAITSLVDCFMVVALILVSVGLYGTLTYHVLQRTREIGVRMALGADASGIILLVARQGANWVLSGLALGALAALGLASLVKSMIYGVGPINSFAMGMAGLCVMVAAGFACWLPARRASKLDPVVALRSD